MLFSIDYALDSHLPVCYYLFKKKNYVYYFLKNYFVLDLYIELYDL